MPVPSLLVLFGALLVLSPEVRTQSPEGLYDVPLTDPIVAEAATFALRTFNQRRTESPNYFKLLRVAQVQAQEQNGKVMEYHVKAHLVKTRCEKRDGWLPVKKIQKCEEIPGMPEVKIHFVLDVSTWD